MMNQKEKRIDEILNRGVIKQVLPSMDAFKQALLSKTLTFYIGADPTGDSLHLSHAKNFMLLEEFRQLGHTVNVLFGDFTACIGDPSDRDSARTSLTRARARENASSWVSQISRIIDFKDPVNPAHVRYNSEWLGKMTFRDVIDLASKCTVARILERDDFNNRYSWKLLFKSFLL